MKHISVWSAITSAWNYGTLFVDASPDLLANSSSNKNDDFMIISHH